MTDFDEARFRKDLSDLLPRLRRFTIALTGAAADADDLTQSALERALVRWRQFTPGTRMDSWVFRIAQNMWIDQMRSRKTRGTVVELDEARGEADPLGDRNAMAAERMDIARAISDLPDQQRVVVALVLVEGWSYREAAGMLDLPVGTVMSRLSRARERIRFALEEEPASQHAAGESS